MTEPLKENPTNPAHFGADVRIREGLFGKARRWISDKASVFRTLSVQTVPMATLPELKQSDSCRKSGVLAGFTVGKLVICAVILAGLGVLYWFSMYLAAERMYQVRGCQNILAAEWLASGQAGVGMNLFQVLLSWLLPVTAPSSGLFASARLLMTIIFWANVILIAMATGERLLSFRWLVALAGAATLAPLWDYGFEIRQGNLVLTGLLLTWGAVRFRPASLPTYAFVGGIAAALQWISASAFCYTVPLSAAILAVPQSGDRRLSRPKLALAWMTGVLLMLLVIYLTEGEIAPWMNSEIGMSASDSAFNSKNLFGFVVHWTGFLTRAPLLWALAASALAAVGVALRRGEGKRFNWDGILPEALFVVVAFMALFSGCVSAGLGVLILVPFAFLLAFRHAATLWKLVSDWQTASPLIAAIVLFGLLVPFTISVRNGLSWPNTRQEGLMSLAEELTDPARDAVYDGVGMVPTRQVTAQWVVVNGLNSFDAVMPGRGEFANALRADPPAVIIPNRYTDQLSEQTQTFIRERYVRAADDLWVLGEVIQPGGGSFEVIHAGRYRLSALEASDLYGTYPEGWSGLTVSTNEPVLSGKLDGAPLPNHPVELTTGIHHIECPAGVTPAVVWVGPTLARLPRIGKGNHLQLLCNWY